MAYARALSPSQRETLRRLRLRPSLRILEELLTQTRPETFAGIWLKPGPARGIIVATSGDLGAYRSLIEQIPFGPKVTVIQVAKSLQTLSSEQREATAYLRSRGIASASDLDILKNRVVVFVSDKREVKSLIASRPAAAAVLSGVKLEESFGLCQRYAEGPANPQVVKPQADGIVLLIYDSPVPSNMMAGIFGRLKVVDGCIRVASGKELGTTVVFPFLFSYRIVEGKLELIYRGKVYAREEDKIGWNGFPSGSSTPKIIGDVSRCPGKFWFR